MKSEWLDILNQVKSGELSAQEGAARLQQLDESPAARPEPTPADEPAQASGPSVTASGFVRDNNNQDSEEQIKRWQRWWLYPFWVGLGIFLLGSTVMAWGFTNERFFWFACAWLPLLLGLLVLVLAAWSRTARWVHVRINDPGKAGEKPTRIAISMPIPVRLAGWGLRVFGPRIPQYKEKNLEMIGPVLEALGNEHEPISVEVNDKDGEKVQVYIV